MMPSPAGPVADAASGNWVDLHAPGWAKPYLRLARADRPIGAWLLFWPCAWAAALVAIATGAALPDFRHIALFLIGAFVMRGAGCTWNDIVDRDIDARVARTASRPLPSGQTTTRKAAIFLAAQLLAGLLVLVQFNAFTIAAGIAALIPVVTYPFMKRITWWPQIVLGLCFGWGALVGWTAAAGSLALPALLLYAAAIAWIIGYDTIYALQDIEDDALVGVRSTARLFGEAVGRWVAGFYAATVVLLGLALAAAGAGALAYLGLAAFTAMLARQVIRLVPADPAFCLSLFKSNSMAAAILFAALTADAWMAAL